MTTLDRVQAAKRGDRDAFAWLVLRYRMSLQGYFARRTDDWDLADDLAQETLLVAFRDLAQLIDDASFPAWLFGIAHHRLLTELRRQRLRQTVSLDAMDVSDDRTLRRPAPDHALQELDRLERALDGLRPLLREALILHGVCGYSSEEVARLLGLSVAAARKRIYRASREFRRRYENEEEART